MIKDDQRGTMNPCKSINVIKQYTMDNKIIERCKTCGKKKNNACKRVSTNQEAVKLLSSRSQPRWIENLSRIYRPDRKFLDESRIY